MILRMVGGWDMIFVDGWGFRMYRVGLRPISHGPSLLITWGGGGIVFVFKCYSYVNTLEREVEKENEKEKFDWFIYMELDVGCF